MFDLAAQFVHYSNRHIFLTGRAGTGKTTFLRDIVQSCHKKLVVLAPTGVAAINAGGCTIHSFFRLPWGCFLPSEFSHSSSAAVSSPVFTRGELRAHFKYSRERLDLIRQLELIVIDEISMVRADLLDTIDYVLRHIRRSRQPFGGVQMLFIGDMLQLPPVLKDDEAGLLKQFYKSHFVFDSFVMQESQPLYIELDKVYRQSDSDFIDLLNKVRNNRLLPADLTMLNSRYLPQFEPQGEEEYIILSSHNRIADGINASELAKLDRKPHYLRAHFEGTFPESMYPAEPELSLKVGAQVMFLRNDQSGERRYYNGKIGRIEAIESDELMYIRFKDEEELLELSPVTWLNIKYMYDSNSDKVKEEILGSFSQFPLRLAWAITIHKSQGLTFEKAIVDAGNSFASGQVYVALSRLRHFEGLVLRTPIRPSSVQVDGLLLDFAKTMQNEQGLSAILEYEQRQYLQQRIAQSFDLHPLFLSLHEYLEANKSELFDSDAESRTGLDDALEALNEGLRTGERFVKQLHAYLQQGPQAYPAVHERVKAAKQWFVALLDERVLCPMDQFEVELRAKTRSRKKRQHFGDLKNAVQNKLQNIYRAEQIAAMLGQQSETKEILQIFEADAFDTPFVEADANVQLASQPATTEASQAKSAKSAKPTKAPKAPKVTPGDSKRESLRLFREGLSKAEIAEQRQFRESTIEEHLLAALMDGEVEAAELASEQCLQTILAYFESLGSVPALKEVFEALKEEYSYFELRVARFSYLSSQHSE